MRVTADGQEGFMESIELNTTGDCIPLSLIKPKKTNFGGFDPGAPH